MDVVVTRPIQLEVLEDPAGRRIKADVNVGSAETLQFLRQEATLPGAHVLKIVRATVVDVRCTQGGDNVFIQGGLTKFIGFETEDGVVQSVEERVALANFVNILGLGTRSGVTVTCNITAVDVGNTLNPATGQLVTRFLLTFQAQAFEVQQITVREDHEGMLIKVEALIGEGEKQVLIEQTKTLAAIKITNSVAQLRRVSWIIKHGKAVVQTHGVMSRGNYGI
ncbi:MAG: hypothetical protein AB1497_11250 [Bacillota bacterium]